MRLAIGALFVALPILQAEAAQYFVSSNGNDSANGTSAQTPFRTPERAMRALAAGDSIYFRAGDYWRLSQAMFVNVSGTAQTPVVIGAYAVTSSGQLQLSVTTNRPILDGGTSAPSLGSYSGLIDVHGRYVQVRDLELRNSGGHGVVFTDTSFGTVENVKVDWTYHTGLQAERSSDITFAACEVVGDSNGWRNYGSEFWGGGITFIRSTRVEVRDCIVREGYGEGLSAFMGSSDLVFTGNTLFATRAVGIYVNASYDVEISNNMVLGTSNSAFHRGGNWVGGGIVLNNESYQYNGYGGSLPLSVYTRDVRVVNNLVASTWAGVSFWNEIDVPMESIEVAHNTFVENAYQISMGSTSYRDMAVTNNIFMSLASNTADAEALVPSGVTWRSNYWSEGAPSTAGARHTGDVYGGLTLRKMSGWQSIRQHTDVNWTDFEPVSGSQTIGRAAVTASVTTDYNGLAFGSPPDIGGLADTGTAGSRPRRPIIISLAQ
jgi:hypothetical protein